MTIHTKMDYRSFLECVEEMATAFFDENGNYVPQIGRIMSVSVFLDYCVEDSGIDSGSEDMIDQIFDNEEVLKAFSDEIYDCKKYEDHTLRFGNAYKDAVAIVDQRKGSFSNALTVFANQLQDIITPENLESIKEAAKDFDALLEKQGEVVPLFPNKKE